MPPRYAYWTIILDGKPTAFRARTEEELLPTLRQLQSRHPDAVMRWFSRGRLWNSQDEERLARSARQTPREPRGRDWRPGGTHEDPRARFKIPRDEKRRRFRDRLHRDREAVPAPKDAPTDESARPRSQKKRPWTPREGDRAWQPKRPPAQGDRDRGWQPPRPSARRPGGERGWKPGGPKGGGGRGGGGRRGGGGGRSR